MITKGSAHIGDFIYLRCESEFYDSIGDARQYSDSNGYMVFERCTVANTTKGAGTWVVVGYMINPMTDAGDIIYGGASGVPTKLVKGTDGQVLKLASGLPTWANESGGGGDELEFSVTRIENTTGSETLYNTTQRKFYLLDITNSASTYTVTISRKPSSGGTAAFTNVEHYVLIRNTAAAAKTLVVQLETTGDKMDSEGLSAVALPASGIYEVGYIWVARGNDNLCIITKSTLLSEITK